jgi:hypothetical protein
MVMELNAPCRPMLRLTTLAVRSPSCAAISRNLLLAHSSCFFSSASSFLVGLYFFEVVSFFFEVELLRFEVVSFFVVVLRFEVADLFPDVALLRFVGVVFRLVPPERFDLAGVFFLVLFDFFFFLLSMFGLLF